MEDWKLKARAVVKLEMDWKLKARVVVKLKVFVIVSLFSALNY